MALARSVSGLLLEDYRKWDSLGDDFMLDHGAVLTSTAEVPPRRRASQWILATVCRPQIPDTRVAHCLACLLILVCLVTTSPSSLETPHGARVSFTNTERFESVFWAPALGAKGCENVLRHVVAMWSRRVFAKWSK